MKSVQQAYGEAAQLDPKEREELLLQQLPQVRYIARRIHDRLPAHVCLDDLIQAGIVGLMDAIQKYDPSKNVQIHSYARFRIRGAILDSLRALDWSPRELRRQSRRIEQIHRQLHMQFGRPATDDEVATEMGLDIEHYQRLLGELRGLDLGSLNGDSEDDGREETAEARIPSNTLDPFQLAETAEARVRLAAAIAELPERDQQILSLYYVEELTMKEVGLVLGVGESRISQIHSSLLVKLRARLSTEAKSSHDSSAKHPTQPAQPAS